jgi:hypothetical protein
MFRNLLTCFEPFQVNLSSWKCVALNHMIQKLPPLLYTILVLWNVIDKHTVYDYTCCRSCSLTHICWQFYSQIIEHTHSIRLRVPWMHWILDRTLEPSLFHTSMVFVTMMGNICGCYWKSTALWYVLFGISYGKIIKFQNFVQISFRNFELGLFPQLAFTDAYPKP